MVTNIESERNFQQARRGDRAAFAEIVRENQSMVYSLLLHSTRDSAVAEEIAQDVFLALYKDLSKLESGMHVTNWLRRVTLQRAIDHARRARVRPKISLDDVAEPVAYTAEPADPYLNDTLRKLTAELPAKSRSILLLRFQEELELNEIAKLMEIPLNTVKSQLHRTLLTLRGKLQEARVRA